MINWVRDKLVVHGCSTRWMLWVIVVGYGIFIGSNHAPIAAGADSGGYLGSARLLSQGKLTVSARILPEFNTLNSWVHTPLGYQMIPGGDILRPTYPVGLPLHYAAAGLVAGWYWGPLLVAVLAAFAALTGCYLCAREMRVSPVVAAAGTAAMAVSPLFLFSSFTPMSDVMATAWCTVAFLTALRSQRGASWAFACGVTFSIAVLVRPADLILFPVLALVLLHWRNLWWAFVGALPGAIGNGIYNQLMWGSPLRSGYGSLVDAFSWKYFGPSLANYGRTLPGALPLMFIGILLLPFIQWRKRPREFGACLLWAIIFMGFYACYEFTSTTWWFLRFIIPAFPAIVILSTGGLEAIIERVSEQWRWAAKASVVLLVVVGSVVTSIRMAHRDHFMLMKEYQEPYVLVCDWAKANLPQGSLVACMQTSSAFFYYTDFPILRWDVIDQKTFSDLKSALRKSGRAFYAVLLPFEVEDALKTRLPGHWEKLTEFNRLEVWKFDPDPQLSDLTN